jgi:vancomycin resistance protein YoaR
MAGISVGRRPRASVRVPIDVSPRARTALAIGVTLGLVLLVGGLALDRAYADRILPRVSASGIELSGLTRAQASEAISRANAADASIELVAGGRRTGVLLVDVGRSVDVDAAVEAAFAVGRGEGPLGDLRERLGLLFGPVRIDPAIRVDEARLTGRLERLAATMYLSVRDAALVETARGWAVVPSRTGREMDLATAVDQVATAIRSARPPAAMILPMVSVEPGLADAPARAAAAEAERMATDVVLALDDHEWVVRAATIRSAIGFDRVGEGLAVTLDESVLERVIATLADDVYVAPTEPRFLVAKSGTTVGFTSGKPGRALATAATTDLVSALIEARRDGAPDARLALATAPIPPKVSEEQAAQIASRMVRVSSWTTKYVVGERNGYGANITIPARIFNGTVLAPGEEFRFWQRVGPITWERGFRMGGVIEGGRTNPTGALGGGICAVSSTLFNAAVRAGYEILERHQHGYYISRYPLGLDATVSMSGGRIGQNMRFRNDTDMPLFIRGLAGPGWITFEIYTVPTGRTVEFSKPTVWNVRKAIDTTIRTDELRKGTTDRQEVPTNGMEVSITRVVRGADGTVVHRDRFYSNYARVNGVLLVGTR